MSKYDIIILEVKAMSSRMERYHKNNTNLRSKRNKNLYNDIYSSAKYTNIEGIASIDNANEIDITKIKEMLQNRENYQKERQYRKITGNHEPEEKPIIKRRITPSMEERDYDIRDILNKAKENKEPDDKERVLKNTEYDVLKKLDLKRKPTPEYESDELKELINTITNTSMLNKMDDSDLASDLLKELRGDDTKVGELNNVSQLIANNKQNNTMDDSFFTSSLKLSKKDFEDGSKSKMTFTKIIIIILVLVIIGAAAILVVNNLGLFK